MSHGTMPAPATFIFFILLIFVSVVAAQTLQGCNTTYGANLATVLSTLPTNIDRYGFYSASHGQAPDRANVIALCRGDIDLAKCQNCVQNAADSITKSSCSDYNERTSWYRTDECLVRRSNQTIFGVPATTTVFGVFNPSEAISPVQFKKDLDSLLNDLRSQASNGGSLKKFATGNVTGPASQTIFALVQCTPDIDQEACERCLISAASQIPWCCDKKRGGRIHRPSCYLRFESYLFFDETRLENEAPPPPGWLQTGKRKNGRVALTIAVAVAVCASLVVIVVVGILVRRSRKSKPTGNIDDGAESLQYGFSTITGATNNFSDEQKLGQGGFGVVYMGILGNGEKIAVKRLSKDSKQGSIEFKNEVLFLAKLKHKNLVNLLGFSLEGTEKLLVYEYVSNGSLDNFISDSVQKHKQMKWETRFKIIEGIAKGLLYLHENSRLKIIHRDIKPGNILLDEDMNPKIADFGMAKLFGQDESEAKTKRIVGTYGYMPPEYANGGQFSVKSDVYSFGVLVLEIINAQKKNGSIRSGDNEVGIVNFAWRNWHRGNNVETVDPFLKLSEGSMMDILRCIRIGLLCCQRDPSKRPTMASVVLMLSAASVTLPAPSVPAFYFDSGKDRTAAQFDENMSENDASITDLHPR
ncbi:cysteine-rich receptor-like protein kinase 44 [Andrographis paniculata]|uniref:cysteine-rich receptor-like protein kinase 44 n=1 Tax=Andrographis paniculata TaxID=175694 RepID=UPI0021E700A5|nr:cysteine-rich receptor-like protein kinase 44 [Andrographis paniculata]